MEEKERNKKDYNLHDFLFPTGNIAKLCRLRTTDMEKINIKEILIKFELNKPNPVIILTGA
jgi:hypothetical protein